MSPDTMTGGDWAVCAFYAAIWLAVIAWLVTSGRRKTGDAAEEIIAGAAAEVVAEAEHYIRQAS